VELLEGVLAQALREALLEGVHLDPGERAVAVSELRHQVAGLGAGCQAVGAAEYPRAHQREVGSW
jgi:hypothetical protein